VRVSQKTKVKIKRDNEEKAKIKRQPERDKLLNVRDCNRGRDR